METAAQLAVQLFDLDLGRCIHRLSRGWRQRLLRLLPGPPVLLLNGDVGRTGPCLGWAAWPPLTVLTDPLLATLDLRLDFFQFRHFATDPCVIFQPEGGQFYAQVHQIRFTVGQLGLRCFDLLPQMSQLLFCRIGAVRPPNRFTHRKRPDSIDGRMGQSEISHLIIPQTGDQLQSLKIRERKAPLKQKAAL
jgi:hypothetical protein